MHSSTKKKRTRGDDDVDDNNHNHNNRDDRTRMRRHVSGVSKTSSAARTSTTETNFTNWMDRTLKKHLYQIVQASARMFRDQFERNMAAINAQQQGLATKPQRPLTLEPEARETDRLVTNATYRYGLRHGDIIIMGLNDYYQCGLPDEVGLGDDRRDWIPPTVLGSVSLSHSHKAPKIRQISAGGMGSFAVSTQGRVYSWGSSDQGYLGRPLDPNMDSDLAESSPGEVTGFVAIDPVTHIKCHDTGFIRQIAAGANHCLALSIHGHVYMWGMYKDSDSGVFSDVEGPDGSPLGFNDVPVHVQFPPGCAKVLDVISGSEAFFNAVLLEDGNVLTWGMGQQGQLARSAGMTDPHPETGDYDLGKSFIGEVYDKQVKDEHGNMTIEQDFRFKPHVIAEKFLKPDFVRYANTLPSQKKIATSVACGAYHLIVAARDNVADASSVRVYVSGLNNYGQLGNGNALTEKQAQGGAKGVQMAHELTPVTDLDGENIIRVAAGEFHCLALDLMGKTLFAWGRCDSGQLGIGNFGDDQFMDRPQVVRFPALLVEGYRCPHILSTISCGGTTSMAVTIDDEVFIWGSGISGATGYQGESDIKIPRLLTTLLEEQYDLRGQVLQASGGATHSMILLQRT